MIGKKERQARDEREGATSERERERDAQAASEECCDDEKWETAAAEQRPPSDS
jgi:hypothetical protein